MQFDLKIYKTCMDIYHMLKSKNTAYGNSALDPIRVFSKVDKMEQIRVRMDDKLSRIKNQQVGDNEDAYMDLLGYLTIYQAEKKFSEEVDEPKKVYIFNSDSLVTLHDGCYAAVSSTVDFINVLYNLPNTEVNIITSTRYGDDLTKLIKAFKDLNIPYHSLSCRKVKDDRPDTVVLPELVMQLQNHPDYGFKPQQIQAVFESMDNKDLCKVWTDIGYKCWFRN